MFRIFLILGLAGTVGACGVVGPAFVQPQMDLASRFAFSPSAGLRASAQKDWWTALNDPVLDALVARAMAQNVSLEVARLRIEESRALLGTTGLNAQLGGSLTGRAVASKTAETEWVTDRSATLQPSFVIDLFGEAKRNREVLLADVDAAAFEAAAARIAVQLEVVTTYMELRYNEAAIGERRRSIALKSKVLEAVRESTRLGELTRVDLRRAEADVATLRAQIPELETGRELAALRLATLLAEPASDVGRMVLGTGNGQPMPPGNIDPGVPAELLRNRPDIRAAEAMLMGALAETGVREAQLYPSLQIAGTLSASTVNAIQLGPVLSFPLLDRGLRKARVEAARVAARRAEARWRQTVLDAVEEVQFALVRMEKAEERERALTRAVALYDDAADLTSDALQLGTVTVDDVLTTQDSASSVRLQRTAARLAYATGWAQLNAALGIGWLPGDPAGAVGVAGGG